jgi:hypothetical protein
MSTQHQTSNRAKTHGKAAAIIVAATVIRMGFAIFIGTDGAWKPPNSVIYESGYFPIFAALWLLFFYAYAILCFRHARQFVATSVARYTVLYITAFVCLMTTGMTGGAFFFLYTSFWTELLVGLCESAAFAALLILSARFLLSDRPETAEGTSSFRILSVLIVAAVYTIGMLVLYLSGIIENAFENIGIAVWTLAMGASFGMSYELLGRRLAIQNMLKKSAYFAGIIIGAPWISFSMFPLLAVKISTLDLFMRAALELVLLLVAVLVCERLWEKEKENKPYEQSGFVMNQVR